jgi:hypothetical protein
MTKEELIQLPIDRGACDGAIQAARDRALEASESALLRATTCQICGDAIPCPCDHGADLPEPPEPRDEQDGGRWFPGERE